MGRIWRSKDVEVARKKCAVILSISGALRALKQRPGPLLSSGDPNSARHTQVPCVCLQNAGLCHALEHQKCPTVDTSPFF